MRQRIAEALSGERDDMLGTRMAKQAGRGAMSLVDWTPLGSMLDAQAAGREVASGNYFGPGLLSLGMAAIPGPAKKVAQAAVKKGIKAYHGSPHDFDRFSMEHIGTGEGAQAYGHGLYFAESEPVARSYRDTLAQQSYKLPDGSTVTPQWDDPAFNAVQAFNQANGDIDKAIELVQSKNVQAPLSDFHWRSDVIKVLEDWRDKGIQPLPPGHMYEVSINADPNDFLDWDRPLSEQPHVPKNLQDKWLPVIEETRMNSADYQRGAPVLGSEFYETIKDELSGTGQVSTSGSPAMGRSQAAEHLRSAGIPGIRYKDAGSRGTEGGTSNYVIFDDKLIEIIRKYGLLGPIALGAGSISSLDQER
jgi:hypothetical protein